jgi:hypothetical protein
VFDHGVSADDYRVIWLTEHHGERRVGRILRSAGNSKWSWHLQPDGPLPAWGNGIAMTLQDATTPFRAAWERYAAAQAGDVYFRFRQSRRPKRSPGRWAVRGFLWKCGARTSGAPPKLP